MPDHVDEFGNIMASGSAAADGTGGFGAGVRRYLTAGVYNGDFYLPPADTTRDIDDNQNQLPYWSFTGNANVSANSTADASSASGRVIHLIVPASAGGGSAALSQIVPVNGARGQSWLYTAIATFVNGSGPGGAVCRVTTTFLKSDGVTFTGSGAIASIIPTAAVTDVVAGATVPADAYFIRITVSLIGDAGFPALTLADLTEVRLLAGPSRLGFAESTNPASFASGYMEQANGVLAIVPTSDALTGGLGVALHGRRIMLNPTGTQTLVAATAIVAASGELVRINAGAPVTITAAPTIANGDDGQTVTILNTGANAITLQDQGTLANSNLRLSAATIVLGTRDSIELVYDATIGDWVQVGQTNVI